MPLQYLENLEIGLNNILLFKLISSLTSLLNSTTFKGSSHLFLLELCRQYLIFLSIVILQLSKE